MSQPLLPMGPQVLGGLRQRRQDAEDAGDWATAILLVYQPAWGSS